MSIKSDCIIWPGNCVTILRRGNFFRTGLCNEWILFCWRYILILLVKAPGWARSLYNWLNAICLALTSPFLFWLKFRRRCCWSARCSRFSCSLSGFFWRSWPSWAFLLFCLPCQPFACWYCRVVKNPWELLWFPLETPTLCPTHLIETIKLLCLWRS